MRKTALAENNELMSNFPHFETAISPPLRSACSSHNRSGIRKRIRGDVEWLAFGDARTAREEETALK